MTFRFDSIRLNQTVYTKGSSKTTQGLKCRLSIHEMTKRGCFTLSRPMIDRPHPMVHLRVSAEIRRYYSDSPCCCRFDQVHRYGEEKSDIRARG
jgi:hypothetical protein